MDVILLEKVRNLGNLGDKVSVKPGYGRNYLIPQGIALPATEANLADFEARRAELEKAAADVFAAAKARADKLFGTTVTIEARAADEGKLYGSLGVREIAMAISDAGAEVAKSEVTMPDGPIRATGEYDVVLQLHTDIEATVHVHVVEEQ